MSAEPMNRATIFLIEEDDHTRPILRQNLQRHGHRVITALDEEDAHDRAARGQVPADLILVDLVGKSPEEALGAGRRIREHAERGGLTPLVVMAEQYGPDLEGTDANVGGSDWITYLEDAEQLERLLARLLGR